MSDQDSSKSWLEKLSLALNGEPSSRTELLELLRSAEQRELLDGEALSIIEGALSVSDMQVREIMIPRAQVVFVRLDQTPEEFLPLVIGSGHSRFPVIGENQDEIVGILLAKDLLPLAQNNSNNTQSAILPFAPPASSQLSSYTSRLFVTGYGPFSHLQAFLCSL